MSELAALFAGYWIVVILIVIVWLLLPFAIFGTKPILRDILREQKEIGRILAAQRGTPETHVLCPYCREPVRNDASKCKHCLSALTPLPPPVEEPKKRIRDLMLPKRGPKQ